MDKKNEYVVKEYEIIRSCLLCKEELTKEQIDKIQKEVLSDEEYLKYAVEMSEDLFGNKRLNSVIAPTVILLNFKAVSKEITQTLLNNLLFEYHDERRTIPLLLTGPNIENSYLKCIISNQDIILKPIQKYIISDCVIDVVSKNNDFELLTMFFIRADVELRHKLRVIDSLEQETLYLFIKYMEDVLITFNEPDIEDDEFDYLLDENEFEIPAELDDIIDDLPQECNNNIFGILELINKKVYS